MIAEKETMMKTITCGDGKNNKSKPKTDPVASQYLSKSKRRFQHLIIIVRIIIIRIRIDRSMHSRDSDLTSTTISCFPFCASFSQGLGFLVAPGSFGIPTYIAIKQISLSIDEIHQFLQRELVLFETGKVLMDPMRQRG